MPQDIVPTSLAENGTNLVHAGDLERPRAETEPDWRSMGRSEHLVQFYESDAHLATVVSGFLAAAIFADEGAIAVLTPSHRASIEVEMQRRGVDIAKAIELGQYVALDAEETLSRFMLNDSPCPTRFVEVIGDLVARVGAGRGRVCAFGEMVSLLCQRGNLTGASRLEALWEELIKTHQLSLLCAYAMDDFRDGDDSEAFKHVCAVHSHVLPAESYGELRDGVGQARAVSILQHKAHVLEAEIARRQNAEMELADFVENAVEGLHKVGPDGVILWANQAELDLLGYSRDEYIGRHITDFHVDQDVIADIIRRLQVGDRIYNQPARLRCKDGSIKHVLIHSNGRLQDGKLVYSRCFTRDVTGVIESERDRALLASIIQFSDDAIISKNVDGIITSWNCGAERVFGYTADEAIGQPVTMLIPPERHDEETSILQRIRRGEQIENYETVRRLKDGTLLDISLTVSPMRDPRGTVIGASKIARDITERKRGEAALREADRRKNEFLATLAHELRNPLAPIQNSLHVLRLSAPDRTVVTELQEVMERQVNHMVRLVDDLLEISRINTGKIDLRLEPVEIASVVRTAVETSRPLIDAGGHELTTSLPTIPLTVQGDAVRLSQVFSNLLNNAARYTPPGGRIDLVTRKDGDEVAIFVRDTGIGIAPEMLTRIFGMFTQAKAPGRHSSGGLGIGLALASSMVGLHGGRIEARSDGEGRGSEFVVWLPLLGTDVQPADVRANGINRGIAASTIPILVVDDNEDAAAALAMLLKVLNGDVRTAKDGQNALAMLEGFHPRLILLDIGMPVLDGYEVARRIRADSRFADVVLVALTGWGQKEDRRKSHAAGFDDHLTKPIDLNSLKTLLARCGSESSTPILSTSAHQ